MNLPDIEVNDKIMVQEIGTPTERKDFVDFHYMNPSTLTKKRILHGLYVGEIIKQLTPDVELHLANYQDEPNTIDYCIKNNIRVISASCYYPRTEEREAELKRYYEWGGVYVACAGNFEGKDVKYPGSSRYTLCVSATNDPDCDGPEIDITADSLWAVYSPNGGLNYFDGTSCATPNDSPCVLIILKKFPSWNLDKVAEFMQANSTPGNEEYERIFRFPSNFMELEETVVENKMDVPMQIVDDRTLIPLRAFAEAIGAVVNWDEGTKTARVIIPKTERVITLETTLGSDILKVS